MEASDRAAVDKIVAKLKDNEYRLADLITEVVTSDMFQKRLMLLGVFANTAIVSPFPPRPRRSSRFVTLPLSALSGRVERSEGRVKWKGRLHKSVHRPRPLADPPRGRVTYFGKPWPISRTISEEEKGSQLIVILFEPFSFLLRLFLSA